MRQPLLLPIAGMISLALLSGCVGLKPEQVIGEYRLKTNFGVETWNFKAAGVLEHKLKSKEYGDLEETAAWKFFYFDLETCVLLQNYTVYADEQMNFKGKKSGEHLIRHIESFFGGKMKKLEFGQAVFERQE
jgi:hypothetical protein